MYFRNRTAATNFEYAGHDGPRSDDVDQRERCNRRPQDSDDRRRNPGGALDQQRSPALMDLGGSHHADQAHYAVQQRGSPNRNTSAASVIPGQANMIMPST